MKIINKLIFIMLIAGPFCAHARLDDHLKQRIMTSIKKKIETKYIDEGKINNILKSLQALSTTTEYKEVDSWLAYAELITTQLRQSDKHFTLQWSDNNFKESVFSTKETWFNKLARKNSGFNHMEILEGNIGYIDFWGFDQVTKDSKKIVSTIMKFVSNAQVLMIDLRNNGGGSGEMVQLISSYFLKPSTHLNSVYSRETDTQRDFFTVEVEKGASLISIPIFILVSNETFSAAEEFAYNLKHLNRAIVIGETTKGGANPWMYFSLDNGFRLGIPIGKAVNPITHSNWEAVGVKPNVAVKRISAFDTAYKLALLKVKTMSKDRYLLEEVNVELLKLKEVKLN